MDDDGVEKEKGNGTLLIRELTFTRDTKHLGLHN